MQLSYTKQNTEVFDNGAERPIESLQGIGTKEWNEIYCLILKQLNIEIIPKKNFNWEYYFKKNNEKIKLFLDNWDLRKKYMKILYNMLIKKYDVVVNGGELIIINPNCIEKLL